MKIIVYVKQVPDTDDVQLGSKNREIFAGRASGAY
jgi:hypothetical protein